MRTPGLDRVGPSWVGQRIHRPEFLIFGSLALLLMATSGRYGWHRDELYFLRAGQHPSWGYPDQPFLTPLLVAAADRATGGSLTGVRLLAALASAATALLTGSLAGEFGGGGRARVIATATWAVSGLALVTGHFVDTSTFDVLAATAVCWSLARAIRREEPRWIAVAGMLLGLGLLDKLLVGMIAACLVAALLMVGPRQVLFTRWTAVGAVVAIAGAAPYLVWQARHGWPQLAIARSIAQDGAEGGRIGVIPFQLLLVSPLLVPVLIAGAVRLARTPRARPFRAFLVAYLFMLAVVIATGGKAYYAAGLLPPLVAAGAMTADGWLAAAPGRRRPALLASALGASLLVNACIGLAVLPARLLQPSGVNALNPDAGEQVGWPAFTAAVADAWRQVPPPQRATAVIFTGNYGEAGAVDRYGSRWSLPNAYSGHNAYAEWGPPPDARGPVIVVGYLPGPWLKGYFTGCRTAATVDNGIGLDNDEQGDPVLLCTSTAAPWSRLWPRLRHDN